MRLLFEIDTKDYNPNGKAFTRPSSRAIIIKDNKILMVHSKMYNYYKFPGGGIDVEETKVKQELDDYEEYEGFTLEAIDFQLAIDVNRNEDHGPKDMLMLEREARVLELLHDEGYLK